jgi:hypothetical protein
MDNETRQAIELWSSIIGAVGTPVTLVGLLIGWARGRNPAPPVIRHYQPQSKPSLPRNVLLLGLASSVFLSITSLYLRKEQHPHLFLWGAIVLIAIVLAVFVVVLRPSHTEPEPLPSEKDYARTRRWKVVC